MRCVLYSGLYGIFPRRPLPNENANAAQGHFPIIACRGDFFLQGHETPLEQAALHESVFTDRARFFGAGRPNWQSSPEGKKVEGPR